MTYSPTTWVDETTPCIDAVHLNNIEDGISRALCEDGTVVGATSQAQELTNGITIGTDVNLYRSAANRLATDDSLVLVDTTSADTGVVYKGANSFLHNFHHPVGGGAVPIGHNTFVGVDAGNFTMGAAATNIDHASCNTGVGEDVLTSVTNGYNNTAVGYLALNACTTGYGNMAVGHQSLMLLTDGYYNAGIGWGSLSSCTSGDANTAIGVNALSSLNTGRRNTAIGQAAGSGVTSGLGNVLIGRQAGDNITSGDRNIVIGYAIDAPNAIGDYQGVYQNLMFFINADGTGTTYSTGRVGIAENTPLAKLHIDQPSDTAAIPVLALDQADMSEGFIDFLGSDRGVITGATDSVGSVRVEINGVVRRLALYADA